MYSLHIVAATFAFILIIVLFPIIYTLIPPKELPDRITSPLSPFYRKQIQINNNLYSEHASEWFDSNGFARGLHAINPTRTQYFYSTIIDFAIQKLPSHSKIKILEVGCGSGLLSAELLSLHISSPHKESYQLEIIGIDPSKESVDKANERKTQLFKHEKIHSLQYLEGSIYDLSLFEQKFDIVLFSDVADHLLDLPLAFQQMNSVFKPNSPKLFLFETITRNIVSYWILKVMGEQVLGMLPPDTHDYRLFVTPSEMDQLIQEYLHCKMTHTQGINPLLSIPLFDSQQAASTEQTLLQKLKPTLKDAFLSNWIIANYLGYATC